VATFSFHLEDLSPRVVTEKLAAYGIYIWDRNFYTLNVTDGRLGPQWHGTSGSIQYNTREEIERLEDALLKNAVG
jgi:selenocysteine lyase/cysteine desulfurase